jgi:hypothetical protein
LVVVVVVVVVVKCVSVVAWLENHGGRERGRREVWYWLTISPTVDCCLAAPLILKAFLYTAITSAARICRASERERENGRGTIVECQAPSKSATT